MRKMATVRRIDRIDQIDGADKIECAVVGGWNVVVNKHLYHPNDLIVYCEIDSWIPTDLAPFLSKGDQPREYNGVKGERLRTVKLRGQVSQGLILPLTVLKDRITDLDDSDPNIPGMDVSDILGIQKWEAAVPAQLAGTVRSTFPTFIPKTDQERVQNLVREVEQARADNITFEITEKLDGSSMTVYVNDEDEGVCSRNLNLKETPENTMWQVARRDGLIEKIRSTNRNLAFQGEIIGPGIQKNRYNLVNHQFFVYDIFDITTQSYLPPEERRQICDHLRIHHVPVRGSKRLLTSVADILKSAEQKSLLNPEVEQEGSVYKINNYPGIADRHPAITSFKAISNKFLMKGGE